MELVISGIKCDTPHCNYREDDVTFEQYPNYINKPCPICSGNLLTQKDYDSCVKTYKIVKVLNILKWINPFFYIGSIYRFLFKRNQEDHQVHVKYEDDGSKTLSKNF